MPRRRLNFTDFQYFSLMNYYAANNYSFDKLKDEFCLCERDKILFENFMEFTGRQQKNGKSYENKNIAGVSYWIDMFRQEHPFMEYGTLDDAVPCPEKDEMFLNILRDRIRGIEGGYVTGGFLDGRVSQMICPIPFAYITYKLSMKKGEALAAFLPEDFNDAAGNGCDRAFGSSRTTNTLGGVLLGPVEGADMAEVLVLKETPFGEAGWGKTYRMTCGRDLLSYTYEETVLLTKKEVAQLPLFSHPPDLSHPVNRESICHDKSIPLYMVGKSYIYNYCAIDPKQSRLALSGYNTISPEELFSLRS